MKRLDTNISFDELRPRLLLLLEMHRLAETAESRAAVVRAVEDVFLATALRAAEDLISNGRDLPSPRKTRRRHLRVVGGTDY